MTTLVLRVRDYARLQPARSDERRAAAALYAALATTNTVDAAVRSLRTFTDKRTRLRATELIPELSEDDLRRSE